MRLKGRQRARERRHRGVRGGSAQRGSGIIADSRAPDSRPLCGVGGASQWRGWGVGRVSGGPEGVIVAWDARHSGAGAGSLWRRGGVSTARERRLRCVRGVSAERERRHSGVRGASARRGSGVTAA